MPPVVTDTTSWLKQAFPLPVVVTLIIYTMTASSFVSSWTKDIESRLASIEKSLQSISNHENRIVVLEQQFIRIREDLTEIKILLRDQKRADINPLTPLLQEAPAR
jgi:phosphoglycerate-specific signal transduction histidine kinase